MELLYNPEILLLSIYQGHKQVLKYMHMHAHSITIHSSQRWETTWISIYRWVDKQIIEYTYNANTIQP